MFWLNWLARLRKGATGNWKGIPGRIQKIFESVLANGTYSAELACILLASQLSFLFNADEQWTKDHIVPLFDWTADGKKALQAFHGFLTWGQRANGTIVALPPAECTEKAFAHIAEFGRVRDRFIEYLAGLAVTSSQTPAAHGWLDRFMLASQDKDRLAWTSDVTTYLRGANDGTRSTAWKWIKVYWARRLSGIPVPLNTTELGKMVEWSLYLGETSFPEVVEIMSTGPPFQIGDTMIFRELAESEFPAKYPTPQGSFY